MPWRFQNAAVVVGMEIHAQLLTNSKLFCACPNRFGEPANTNTCPVCLGHPGTLPVLNRRVVELVQTGTIGKIGEVHVWMAANTAKTDSGSPVFAGQARMKSFCTRIGVAAVARSFPR